MANPLRILSVSAEVSPLSKTGGLGDVAHALPKALARLGHRVTVVTPFYQFLKRRNDLALEGIARDTVRLGYKKFRVAYHWTRLTPEIPLVFVDAPGLLDRPKIYQYDDDNLRFLVFCRAVILLIRKLTRHPHIIHCHDWHTGLIPNYLKTEYKKDPKLARVATLFTIHNLPFQFQHDWWTVPPHRIDSGRNSPSTSLRDIPFINFMKRGILNADIINTVSERYAREILTPEFGQGLERYLQRRQQDVHGIINGIDYTVFNPAFDKSLPYNYDWNSLDKKRRNKCALQKLLKLDRKHDVPLIGLVHRLTEQKGFNLIMETADFLLKLPLQIVVAGTGNPQYVQFFRKLARRYPTKFAFVNSFTKVTSLVYAGSDMFLMPSRYEPCGMSQLISIRYGSIPIVHEIGGLSDTIANFNPKTSKGIGFVFSSFTREAFLMTVARALETFKYPKVWEHLTWQAMKMSYSWELPAKKYVNLFRRAMEKRRKWK